MTFPNLKQHCRVTVGSRPEVRGAMKILAFSSHLDHLWPHNFISLCTHTQKRHTCIETTACSSALDINKLIYGWRKNKREGNSSSPDNFKVWASKRLGFVLYQSYRRPEGLVLFLASPPTATQSEHESNETCHNIDHNDLYHQVLMFFYEAEMIIIIFIIIMKKCQNLNWAQIRAAVVRNAPTLECCVCVCVCVCGFSVKNNKHKHRRSFLACNYSTENSHKWHIDI